MTALLDANVLIALTQPQHVHFEPADQWFDQWDAPFATCPTTEGALARQLVRSGTPPSEVRHVLDVITSFDRHEFWVDDLSYRDVPLDRLQGHRQVTDAYLAQAARRRSARLATFDRGLAALHPDVALLIET